MENDDAIVVDIPRETEHIVVTKYWVDKKNLCGQCVYTHCHRIGVEKFDAHFSHDVVTIPIARALYEDSKCDICSIGLMRVLGQRDCPTCHCAACEELVFPEKCVDCQHKRTKFIMRVTEFSVQHKCPF